MKLKQSGPDIADAVAELIAAKAVTRELGDAARPAVLVRFTEEEFGRAERRDSVLGDPERGARWDEVRERTDAWFRDELRAGSRTTR